MASPIYLSRQDFSSAYVKTMANKRRIYASSGRGDSGFERVRDVDFPDISHTPKFKLDEQQRMFTIGSCFARNVEHVLARRGINCLTTRQVLPGDFYELTGLGARSGALNAYTPMSMLELVKLATDERRGDFGALKVGEGEWIDMMVSGLRVLTTQELQVVRKFLFDIYRTLPTAEVVFITLGYTESWFDTVDGIYVNRSPGGSRRAIRHGSRYEFHNANAQTTVETLRQIVEYIHGVTGEKAKIILTVSPVPLHGTFTNRDVVTANLYSKCTLLSSAVQVAEEYSYVDYFPSYELVTFSRPELTWAQDGVHVNQGVVEKIMEKFQGLYFDALAD